MALHQPHEEPRDLAQPENGRGIGQIPPAAESGTTCRRTSQQPYKQLQQLVPPNNAECVSLVNYVYCICIFVVMYI
jgi:hypothetical protein